MALASGGAGQVRVIGDCRHEQYKPRQIILACGDGSTLLEKLSWSSWTATKAHGRGSYAFNDCTPSCAAGRFKFDPVTVTLSRPVMCRHQSHRVWSRAALNFTARRPQGVSGTVRLFCPNA